MIKKVFSILMVAMFATAMVSCDKGDENYLPPLNLADNTLAYDGETYEMQTIITYVHHELTYITALSVDTNAAGEHLVVFNSLDVRPEIWNRTMNLASPAVGDAWVFRIIVPGLDISSMGGNSSGVPYFIGKIDNVRYEDESIFTIGTLSVSGNNDGTPITVTMNARLKNGKVIQMKLVSDNYEDQINASKR